MDAAANMAEYFVSEDQNNQNHYIIACGGSAIGNEMHRLRTIGDSGISFRKHMACHMRSL